MSDAETSADVDWLAKRVGVSRAWHVATPKRDEQARVAHPALQTMVSAACAGTVVEPSGVAAAVGARPVIALIGWPTGRHHSLVKAAEARLAAEHGADEVWLCVDSTLLESGAEGENAVLADIIAVSQVIEGPTRVGVTGARSADAATALAGIAEKAGVTVIGIEAADELALPETSCEIAVFGSVASLDAAVDALWAGAARVFVG